MERGVDLLGEARVQELLRALLGFGEGHLLVVIAVAEARVFSAVGRLLLGLEVVEARRLD